MNFDELPPTREAAKACGCKFYFTGNPCKKGHVSKRYTSNFLCVGCVLEKTKAKSLDPNWRAYQKEWNAKNREYFRERARRRRAANPDLEREKARVYMREKYRRPEQKMRVFLSSCVRNLINNKRKKTAESLVGYTRKELVFHIERQFKRGMTWSNYGQWHVDHIIPVSKFIADGVADPAIVNALTNLCPMWATENMSKSDKVETLL